MKKKLSDFRQKMREDKKGFTLVELIVVLVILAILIALLVPTLTGYIDNANKKKVASEGRQILMAAKTIAADDYNSDEATKNLCGKTITTLNVSAAGAATDDPTIEKLSEVKNSKYTSVSITFDADGTVSRLVYTGKKFTATFDGSAWSTTKN